MRTRAVVAFLSFLGVGTCAAIVAQSDRAMASSSVSIASGWNATRTTIPVTVNGRRVSCVLDTGTSAMIVSPWLAQAANLTSKTGTFELAPDGRTYVDRQTEIPRFDVAGYTLHDLPALISQNVSDVNALCGYDFFAHFPTLIDRRHQQVTLFPPASRLARMRCTPVDLAPRVPLATVEINDTWVRQIVLDSGMAGGGALWDGVRSELRQPLVADAGYETMPTAIRQGFSCGAVASVRYAAGSATSAMPLCTEAQRPDGYNGIIETNLSTVGAMAVDYPHRRICFDVADAAQPVSPSRTEPMTAGGEAWARFNSMRPPKTR